MTDCRRIESLLPPYVDGEAPPDAAALVEAHLRTCAMCRAEVAAERGVRMILRARAAEVTTPAPPGLRTRIAARLAGEAAPSLGWGGRVAAFGAAAAMVLLFAVALEFLPLRSNALFAAQLAIDHLRCFVVTSSEEASAPDLEREFAERDGWAIDVPPSSPADGITLIAGRRCPFWLGDHAHLLYRSGDHHVSLFVTQGVEREGEQLSVLGHAERIWAANGSSYTLIARGVERDDLDRLATYLERVSTAAERPAP